MKSPEGGALKDENIKLLIDDVATKNNIIYDMQSIANKADANDVILIQISSSSVNISSSSPSTQEITLK